MSADANKRKRKPTMKMVESECEEVVLDQSRSIVLKCAQTGETLFAQVKDVTQEDMKPINLTKGAELLYELKGKVYPVQFVSYKEDIPTTSKQKRPKQATKIPSPAPVDDNTTSINNAKGSSLLDDQVSRRDILLKAASAGSGGEKTENSPEGSLTNLVLEAIGKLDAMSAVQTTLFNKMEEILNILKSKPPFSPAAESIPIAEPQSSATNLLPQTGSNEVIVNGTNVLIMPSKNPYTFGLTLLDMFFSREELSMSLLFSSSKSDRASLDQAKVSRIIEIMNKRYQPGDWDMKTFVAKANQKCRDSKP